MKERAKVIIVFAIVSVLSFVSLFMMYQEKNDFEQQYFHLADLQNIQNDSLGQLLDQDNILERLNVSRKLSIFNILWSKTISFSL